MKPEKKISSQRRVWVVISLGTWGITRPSCYGRVAFATKATAMEHAAERAAKDKIPHGVFKLIDIAVQPVPPVEWQKPSPPSDTIEDDDPFGDS